MANQRGKDMIVGAIAGTVLGAVTALLLAPKSGRELRADIADGCQQVSGKTQQIASTVSEKTQHAAKQVSTQTSELIGKAKQATAQAARQVRAWKSGSADDKEAAIEETPVEEVTALTAEAAEEEEKQQLTLVR